MFNYSHWGEFFELQWSFQWFQKLIVERKLSVFRVYACWFFVTSATLISWIQVIPPIWQSVVSDITFLNLSEVDLDYYHRTFSERIIRHSGDVVPFRRFEIVFFKYSICYLCACSYPLRYANERFALPFSYLKSLRFNGGRWFLLSLDWGHDAWYAVIHMIFILSRLYL